MCLFKYLKMLVHLVISLLQIPNFVENLLPSKEGFEPVTVSPEIGRTAVSVLWVVFPWIALIPCLQIPTVPFLVAAVCPTLLLLLVTDKELWPHYSWLCCLVIQPEWSQSATWEIMSSGFRRKVVFLQSIGSKLNRQRRANEKNHRLFFLSAVDIEKALSQRKSGSFKLTQLTGVRYS